MADAKIPKQNLIRAKIMRLLEDPAIKDVILNPIAPIASIHFLFQFLDCELMKMFEVEYAALNINDATIP